MVLNIKKGTRLKKSAAKAAFDSLRLAIGTGKLLPEQQINEIDIAEKLGMSRTPVREAMKQLEMLGHLERLPNHRLVVAKSSFEDIIGMFEIREALETKAIQLTCERANDKQLEAIQKIYNRCNTAIEKRDPDEFAKLNWVFHKEMILACGNNSFWRIIENNKEQFFIQLLPRSFNEIDWRNTQKEHREILEALIQRNKAKSVKAIQRHIKTSAKLSTKL